MSHVTNLTYSGPSPTTPESHRNSGELRSDFIKRMKLFERHAHFFFKHGYGDFNVIADFDTTDVEKNMQKALKCMIFTHRTRIVVYSHLFWPEQLVTSVKFLHQGKMFVGHFGIEHTLGAYLEPVRI